MEEVRNFFQQMLDRDLIQMTLSGTADPARAEKVKVRPVLIQDELFFQETLYRGTQVFHENLGAAEMADRLEGYMGRLFRQAQADSVSWQGTLLVSKKGKVTCRRRRKNAADGQESPAPRLEHDRPKRYILREGHPVDFLVELGVQTPDGRIAKARYDKFRQINRYLEFIEDILDRLPGDRTLRIIDFGCGKSYLTFAMYYYLHEM